MKLRTVVKVLSWKADLSCAPPFGKGNRGRLGARGRWHLLMDGAILREFPPVLFDRLCELCRREY